MVKEKITEIIVDTLDIDASELDFTASIKDDLDIDSLDLFQIIAEIEDTYEITIDGLEELQTLDELVSKVEELI